MIKKIIFFISIFLCNYSIAQNLYSGYIKSSEDNKPINNVEIYDKNGGEITQTNIDGFFRFTSEKREITLVLFARNFNVYEQKIESNSNISIKLRPLSRELMEVEVKSRKQKIFELKRLKDIEGTSIYAGKKK